VPQRPAPYAFLLERNESGRVGGTNTRTTVLDGLVRDREFTQVVTGHLRLDFNSVESLAVVDANNATDHFWDDDHVTEVGLDDGGLFVW